MTETWCPVCERGKAPESVWCYACWTQLLRSYCSPDHAARMLRAYWPTWQATHPDRRQSAA